MAMGHDEAEGPSSLLHQPHNIVINHTPIAKKLPSPDVSDGETKTADESQSDCMHPK